MTGAAPSVRVGGAVLWCAVALSVVIAVAAWFAPDLAGGGRDLRLVRGALGADAARSVPSWWSSVLFVLAALGAHGQAAVLAATARRRADRLLGAGAVAWWVVAAMLVWLSVDHALSFHDRVPVLGVGWLPEALRERPVELVLTALALVVALPLLAVSDGVQRALVLCAGVAFVVGQVLIGTELVPTGLSLLRRQALEVALQWTGALLLLVAAARRPPSR